MPLETSDTQGFAARYVIGIALLPTRVSWAVQLIREIESWRYPPYRIFLTVSPYYYRLRRRFHWRELPRFIRQHPDIEILWRHDLGPINKVFWALEENRRDFSHILSLDDDRCYPDTLVSDLFGGIAQFPESAIGLRGRRLAADRRFENSVSLKNFPNERSVPLPARADILLGTNGVLYPSRAFHSDFFERYRRDIRKADYLFYSDDIYLSGYLAERGIARWVVPSSKEFGQRKLKWPGRVSGWLRRRTMGDGLWAINESGPFNNLGIEFWAEAWGLTAEMPDAKRAPNGYPPA